MPRIKVKALKPDAKTVNEIEEKMRQQAEERARERLERTKQQYIANRHHMVPYKEG